MKLCDFCDHCCRTERGEDVCTKRLIYVGDLENYYPCNDFVTTLKHWAYVVLIGLAAIMAIICAVVALF